MRKIIGFPKPDKLPFYEFIEHLEKAYKEDRLKNFICIYDYKYEKGKEREGFVEGLNHYWFGEKSTVYLLGLLEVMKDEILIYMQEKCDEVREGENE